MSSSRALAALVAICFAPALGLGCGGESADSGSGASAEALAKVRASDYARAVNLRASDVPYFEPVPDDEEEDEEESRKRDRELERCVGAREVEDPLTEVKSATFGTQSPGELLQVSSEVEVVADAEEAARQLRLLRSRRAERCLQRIYVSALEEEDSSTAEVSNASLSHLPFPSAEISGGFAFRFSASVTVYGSSSQLTAYRPDAQGVVEQAAKSTVKVYVDILGFVVGPAEVTLSATGAPAPVSRNLESSLLRVLHERATER
jgi:hypothetical protein